MKKQHFTHHSPSAIEVDSLNVIIIGITPVHGTGSMVQSESIGPQHVRCDKYFPVGPIHPGFLYSPDAVVHLILFPIRPVHPTATKTKTQSV